MAFVDVYKVNNKSGMVTPCTPLIVNVFYISVETH